MNTEEHEVIKVNALKTMELMGKYAICEKCGSDKIGNGAGALIVTDDMFTRSCRCGWSIEVNENDEVREGINQTFKVGQSVKHISRKLSEATFAGYTKSGRVRVEHNACAPYGVCMVVDTFSPNNIVSARG